MSIAAKVFKTETFGAVDGPGVRLVLFLQGCSFRCKYCHNPESWPLTSDQAKDMTIEDVIHLYNRNKEFYEKGGITLSGGEPMMQHEFIKAFAQECKKQKIHLAIDTSACNFLTNKQAYIDLLDLVDLWIVDIKATDSKLHQEITGCADLTGMELIKWLEQNKKPFWIRQVIVKSVNEDIKHLQQLADFIKPLKYCQKYELLSYHNLMLDKYKKLGIDYPYKDKKTLSTKEFDEIKQSFNNIVIK